MCQSVRLFSGRSISELADTLIIALYTGTISAGSKHTSVTSAGKSIPAKGLALAGSELKVYIFTPMYMQLCRVYTQLLFPKDAE